MSFSLRKVHYDHLYQIKQTGQKKKYYWLTLFSSNNNINFHPNQGSFSAVTTFIGRLDWFIKDIID